MLLPARKYDHQPTPWNQPELRLVPGGGLELFTCPNIAGSLRLSKISCARQFVLAQKANIESSPQLVHCRTCSTGEVNAGIKAVPVLPTACVHCERGAYRKVGKIYCISCYNRVVIEFVKGKNARGAPPIRFAPLYLFEYNSSLIVIGKDEGEAQRVVTAMTGEFKESLLIKQSKATSQDFTQWWCETIKPFSAKRTQRISMKL